MKKTLKMNRSTLSALETLNDEAKSFLHAGGEVDVCSIEEIANDPIRFCRDYAAKNMPVLITGGCSDWPAVKKWNSMYFSQVLGEQEVTVAVTPNGYADGLVEWTAENGDRETVFAQPEERKMKMNDFLQNLDDTSDNYVCYIQQQNSNLLGEFSELFRDVVENVDWASKTFNKKPDAINFWMGDKRAISSMHKDPYENLYCVIDGYKDFILIPPTDLPWVYYDTYKRAIFKNVTPTSYELKLLKIGEDGYQTLPWISVDPLNPDYKKYPEFKRANVYKIRVNKGDMLYIPSLWFHHVSQSHGCIAVNYWYDMDYDIKYCYYLMLESMCRRKKNKSCSTYKEFKYNQSHFLISSQMSTSVANKSRCIVAICIDRLR